MKVVIPGGSGYLGHALATRFQSQGHDVVTIARRPDSAAPGKAESWDGKTLGDWAGAFEDADLIINLAGRSVNCRYNEANKAEIYASRLDSTRVIGQAIAATKNPPRTWLNSSSATIYRHAEDRPMDEKSGEIGSGFSVDVCQRWERALDEANTPNTRKVAMRTAMVMGPGQGGPFEAFYRLVRMGLGGPAGNGRQFVSWIHLEDFARAIDWLHEHAALEGAINIAAPDPKPNREFMLLLRQAHGAKIGLPAYRWMLEIGAVFLKTETELIVKSRRVIPGRLLESGFQFTFPAWREASVDLVRRWREPAVHNLPK